MTLGRSGLDVAVPAFRLVFRGKDVESARDLVGSVSGRPHLLDVTAGLLLWGEALRGVSCPVMLRGGAELAARTSFETAGVLVESEVVSALSSLGRRRLDVFLLSVGQNLSGAALDGALESLQRAKASGLIGSIGACFASDSARAIADWSTRDSFDIALLCESLDALEGLRSMAQARQVGLIAPADAAVPGELPLVTVANRLDVETSLTVGVGLA